MKFFACFAALLVNVALSSLTKAKSSTDCDQVCNSKDFSRQVCGSDGETYQSKCVLRLKKCTSGKKLYVEYEGACRAPPSCTEERKRVLKSIKDRQLLRVGIFIPECYADGSYSEVQCSVNKVVCWCVDKFGVEFDDTRVRAKRPDCRFRRGNTHPSNERYTRILKGCSKDNRVSFNKKVISRFKKEMRGKKGKQSPKGIAEWKMRRLDADKNSFLNHREVRALIKELKRVFSPRKCGKTFFYYCDDNSDYLISENEWLACLGIREARQDTPQCFSQQTRAKREQTKNPSTIVFIPSCNKDGTYKTVQCEKVSKFCWCVNSITGRNIPNTSVQNARPDCSKPPRRIRPVGSTVSISTKKPTTKKPPRSKPSKLSTRDVKVKECDDTSWKRFREELLKMLRRELETLTNIRPGGNSTKRTARGSDLFRHTAQRLPDAMVTAWKFSQLDVDRDRLMDHKELFSSRMKKMFGKIRRGRKCSKKFAVSCDSNRNGGLSLDEWRKCLRRSRRSFQAFLPGLNG